MATRKAYGEALAAVGSARGDVVALDGEVSNSTFAEIFAKAHPERYFEMYIAEQQLVAAAVGLQARGWRPFASTFAAFLSRAYDFVRMAAISRASFVLSGSHAGVSIGEDGPSQMALEDIAAFRAVHGSVVLHPCDANQTARLVAALADHDGIGYIRTLRPATPVLYGADEEFEIGGSRVLRSSDEDDVAIVAAGITLHEALAAADVLAGEGIAARVIDLYSIKPLDQATLVAASEATEGRLVTVEDHWPEGGLGEAVASRARRRGRAGTRHGARRPWHAVVREAGGASRRCGHRRRRHRGSRPPPRAVGSRLELVDHVAERPVRPPPYPLRVDSDATGRSAPAVVAAAALAVGAAALLWGAGEAHYRGCVEAAAARYPPIAVSAFSGEQTGRSRSHTTSSAQTPSGTAAGPPGRDPTSETARI